jgi:hypothetical protein
MNHCFLPKRVWYLFFRIHNDRLSIQPIMDDIVILIQEKSVQQALSGRRTSAFDIRMEPN